MNRYYKRERIIHTKMAPTEVLPENALKWSAILYDADIPKLNTDESDFSYRLVHA